MKKLLAFLCLLPTLAVAGVHVQQGDANITIGSVTVTGAGIKFADGTVQVTSATTGGGCSSGACINNQSTLQSGSTFYVSSGTVQGQLWTNNTAPTGLFEDPANIVIGRTAGSNGCIRWTDGSGATSDFQMCKNGLSTTLGFSSISGGMTNFLNFGTSGAFPLGSTVTVGTELIYGGAIATGPQTWTNAAPSTFTYGVAMGSLTLTGTGNFTFTNPPDGLTYQGMGSTETSTTVNRFMVGSSSNTLINSTLRSTLVAVDSNGVAISSNPTFGGTPTGPNYAVQTSSNGAFGGANNFQWNGSSVSILASSVTIKSGNPNGSDNASVGTFNIFNVGTAYTSMPFMTIGSDAVGLEFSVAEQRYTLSKYGFRGSNLALDQAADNTLRSINLNNLIQIDNSGEMDIQTDNASNGGKNIVFKPGLTSEVVVSTLGVTASTNTAITTGYLQLYSRTKAQIAVITPVPTTVGGVVTGQEYYCSDCTTTSVCISTGSAKGAFSTMANLTTACN